MSLNKESILITGSSGFIGTTALKELKLRKYPVRSLVVSHKTSKGSLSKEIYYENLDSSEAWRDALDGIECIIHLAGKAHFDEQSESSEDLIKELRKANIDLTNNLAKKAALHGVKRFIYISSIKVNGEKTTKVPFSEEDEPNPKDNYGVSKYEAEKLLMGISKQAGMEIVIIRPPLVYGPGVKANFLRLIKLVDTRIPLPFLFVKNKRSYISIDNLIDFIILCIKHPRAANETFLISDGENLSTRSLVNLISQSLGKHSLLLPLPVWAMKFFGKLFGKKKEIDKLCDSLEVDISKAINLLSWVPKEDISRSIKEAVKYYQEN